MCPLKPALVLRTSPSGRAVCLGRSWFTSAVLEYSLISTPLCPQKYLPLDDKFYGCLPSRLVRSKEKLIEKGGPIPE